MTLDQRAALASPDISVRLEAVAELARKPDVARPLVVALLVDPDTPVIARVWAMLTIYLIKDDSQGMAFRALVQSLDAVEGIVRRCAIEVLGELKADRAVAQIADHLTDHETIDGAWFEDDSTPSEAARRALESIGTPEALRVLALHPGTMLPAVSVSARLRRARRAMRLLRSGGQAGGSTDRAVGVTSDAWYYRDAEKDPERCGGPVAFEQLIALMRSGQLSAGLLVSSDMVEWQEADTMGRILRAIPVDRERIIREFIEYGEAENPDWGWASDRMYSILDGAPEIAWEIIVELVDRAPSDGSLSFFAAGPLEDLLSKDGPDFIDRVEERSAMNERFRRAVGMLHRLGMADDVWGRVQAIASCRSGS
jgi:hypothetical protein